MFQGFKKARIEVQKDVFISCRIGGQGPPLLLVHGYPQTHVMWHKVAPALSEKFTVVASDLRGYGDSSTPPSDPEHLTYSKRAMALDQRLLMEHLGFAQFSIAGHDRGGRVAHRLVLDHPGAVQKLAVLDIAPTHNMYSRTDFSFARSYYHWFFLIQPYDLPERLIGADPEFYLTKKFKPWGRSSFDPMAMKEYIRCFDADTIHASCEDYRSSASVDLQHDEEDLRKGSKIKCPVLALWGQKGFVGQAYNLVREWEQWADNVHGYAMSCGHYLPEEAPGDTLKYLMGFFDGETI